MTIRQDDVVVFQQNRTETSTQRGTKMSEKHNHKELVGKQEGETMKELTTPVEDKTTL
jgi:hypothetical protein